jgi:hypothetical protein
MKHIITLSGSSNRFISKGYPHKAILDIDGKSSTKVFTEYIEDFEEHETIFLCRNEDLKGPLKKELESIGGLVLGIETNSLGPLYSLRNIHDFIMDDDELLITYIDAIQKFNIGHLQKTFKGYGGGLTTHGLKHPHWRHNQYYCFVRHDGGHNCTEVIEKYNFKNIFLDVDTPLEMLGLGEEYHRPTDLNNCRGSNGSYYFQSGRLFKEYSDELIRKKKTVNGEYYVTQLYQEMIGDGVKVRTYDCPYVSFGIPEDVEDFLFWKGWFKCC